MGVVRWKTLQYSAVLCVYYVVEVLRAELPLWFVGSPPQPLMTTEIVIRPKLHPADQTSARSHVKGSTNTSIPLLLFSFLFLLLFCNLVHLHPRSMHHHHPPLTLCRLAVFRFVTLQSTFHSFTSPPTSYNTHTATLHSVNSIERDFLTHFSTLTYVHPTDGGHLNLAPA